MSGTITIPDVLRAKIKTIRLVAFDFDGVFTDNAVYVSEDGAEAVRCYRGDAFGLRQLECLGIACAIISTETNPVVTARSRKLRIRCIQSVSDKSAALQDLLKELNLVLEQTAYLGNDVNDLTCLTSVGLPMVVQDAHPDVLPCALYQTRARGGYGAVREIGDLFSAILGAGSR